MKQKKAHKNIHTFLDSQVKTELKQHKCKIFRDSWQKGLNNVKMLLCSVDRKTFEMHYGIYIIHMSVTQNEQQQKYTLRANTHNE